MEAGWPCWRAASFAEIGIRLVLYAKNGLGKRVFKAMAITIAIKNIYAGLKFQLYCYFANCPILIIIKSLV